MKSHPAAQLNRREFLNLAGLSLGGFLLPGGWLAQPGARLRMEGQWPALSLADLPPAIAQILRLAPDVFVDGAGVLTLRGADGLTAGQVPQRRTRWNLAHSTERDRLRADSPWGIVLHWFGDTPEKDLDLDGYLRGFNGKRQEGELIISTSAHFLAGDERPAVLPPRRGVGLAQTQAPAADGTPYLATHLRGLSFGTHEAQKQYFVRAYYELAERDPTVHSLLQDLYDGRWVHPNERTIAIEVTGADFDDDLPSPQKTANVLALTWALMQRYRIAANRLLGHHEIQMNKGDPGKQFMATMRFLLGVKALVADDPLMKLLVFGQHLAADGDTQAAVRRYFRLVRDYHVLTSKPNQLYQWETLSKYWLVYPLLDPAAIALPPTSAFGPPIPGEFIKNGYEYLVPENHEGIDLHYPIPPGGSKPARPAEVQLIAPGECLYLGEVNDCHQGRLFIFRHQQQDGAQVLSIYGHLSELSDLRPGLLYPAGTRLGLVDNQSADCGRFLHFAIGYGAAWDLSLQAAPAVPYGAGPTWIRERYLEPVEYLRARA